MKIKSIKTVFAILSISTFFLTNNAFVSAENQLPGITTQPKTTSLNDSY